MGWLSIEVLKRAKVRNRLNYSNFKSNQLALGLACFTQAVGIARPKEVLPEKEVIISTMIVSSR